MVRGDYLRGTWGWDRAWRAAGARELYGGVDAEFTFDSGMESIFMRRGREQELLLGFRFVHTKSTISQRIFIICMFKEHNLLILWRWRVENNLKMEDGWERSLHRRASMGKRSRSFYLDSDLNFFNQLHFRMHVLNRIPVFAQVTTGKVTASL